MPAESLAAAPRGKRTPKVRIYMKYFCSILTLITIYFSLTACSKKKKTNAHTQVVEQSPSDNSPQRQKAAQDQEQNTSSSSSQGPSYEGDQDLFLRAQAVLDEHCISCHSSFHNEWSELHTEQDWIRAMGQSSPLINLNLLDQSLILQRTQGYGNSNSNMPLANDNAANDFTAMEYDSIRAWVLSIQQTSDDVSLGQSCDEYEESIIEKSLKSLNEDELLNSLRAIFSVNFTNQEVVNFNLPLDTSGKQYHTNNELRVLRGISQDPSVLDDLYPALTKIAENIISKIIPANI